MKKELKIEVPQGYEIDKEKSTFEKIVFKKVEDPFSKLPKTWKEYCDCNRGNVSYFWSSSFKPYIKSQFVGAYYEFSTEGRLTQYVTLGKLLQLRDYWVGNWKNNSNDLIYVIYNDEIKNARIGAVYCENYPLTFPTKEMAEKFKNCFEDLIKEAYPLV